MKILQKYVIVEVLKTYLLSMIIFTSIIFLGNMFRETRNVQQVGPEYMIYLFPLILPDVIVRVNPVSILIAVSLVFGRLSSDNEINAMKTSGMNIMKVIFPILAFSILITVITLNLSLNVVPSSRYKKKDLREQAFKMLIKGSTIGRTPFRIAEYRILYSYSDKGVFHDIRAMKFDEEGNRLEFFSGETGVFTLDEEKKQLKLELKNGLMDVRSKEGAGNVTSGKYDKFSFYIDAKDILSDKPKRLIEMRWSELLNFAAKKNYVRYSPKMINAEIAKRFPWGLNTFFLAFLGIPLGILSKRGGVAAALGIAISVGILIYFPLMMFAEALSLKSSFPPQIIMWIPNLLILIAGVILSLKVINN